MKKLLIAALATSLLAAVPAHAQTPPPPPTGNVLYEWCTKQGAVYRSGCDGYLSGYFDALVSVGSPGFICTPNGTIIAQAKDVLVRWLSSHPEKRHFAAGVIATGAFMEAWPCPTKSKP
ncbi:MAG TPA: Rap1a/Tai family immunity protein [Bradyrhizobium sp.]